MCMYVHVCVCVCHIYAVPWSSEDSIKSLEAEVTRGCDHLMWVLRIELPSSGRAANALNGWNISPAWRIFHFCFPFYFPFLLFPHPTYTILRFSSSFSFSLVSLVFSFSPLPSLLPPLSHWLGPRFPWAAPGAEPSRVDAQTVGCLASNSAQLPKAADAQTTAYMQEMENKGQQLFSNFTQDTEGSKMPH